MLEGTGTALSCTHGWLMENSCDGWWRSASELPRGACAGGTRHAARARSGARLRAWWALTHSPSITCALQCLMRPGWRQESHYLEFCLKKGLLCER